MSAIDPRSAVFLQEMGIGPVWTLRRRAEPQAPAHAEAEAEAAAPTPASAPLAPPPAPMRVAPPMARGGSAWSDAAAEAARVAADSAAADAAQADAQADAAIARMDWDELAAAIASCTRCAICKNKKPIYGAGARQATWLVTAGAASAADEKEGQPLAGDSGRLLVNMLAAVGLSRESNAYVTNLIKCRPTTAGGGDRAPTLEEAMACRPYLERELSLSGAALVLTLGQIAANALQGKALQEPLAQSRGQVRHFKGVRHVATLHPGELLRRGGDKALAWADLCLARANDGRDG